jgi:hypothetical protein
MRRIFAITTIAALIFSMAAPVWATACAAMDKVQMCHRTVGHHHHCDMMMDTQDATAAPDSEAAVNSLAGKCPMQCCMQAQAGNGTVLPAAVLLFQLPVSEYRIDFPAITFTSTGFSSHTDRGPPAA